MFNESGRNALVTVKFSGSKIGGCRNQQGIMESVGGEKIEQWSEIMLNGVVSKIFFLKIL